MTRSSFSLLFSFSVRVFLIVTKPGLSLVTISFLTIGYTLYSHITLVLVELNNMSKKKLLIFKYMTSRVRFLYHIEYIEIVFSYSRPKLHKTFFCDLLEVWANLRKTQHAIKFCIICLHAIVHTGRGSKTYNQLCGASTQVYNVKKKSYSKQ